MWDRLSGWTPFLAFVGLIILLRYGIGHDPHKIPSPLLNKPVPTFNLKRILVPSEYFTDEDLLGKVSLVNVWASWCGNCRAEHPFLQYLASQKIVPIYGINYKDRFAPAVRWLKNGKSPYEKVGFDQRGDVSINWGVYGVPETYVIDSHGVVRDKVLGPMSPDLWQRRIFPLIQKLKAEDGLS